MYKIDVIREKGKSRKILTLFSLKDNFRRKTTAGKAEIRLAVFWSLKFINM